MERSDIIDRRKSEPREMCKLHFKLDTAQTRIYDHVKHRQIIPYNHYVFINTHKL